jgi:hypothetical protein
MTEGGRQKAEGGRQKAEGRRRKEEGRIFHFPIVIFQLSFSEQIINSKRFLNDK